MINVDFTTPTPDSFSDPYFFFTNDRDQQLLYVSPSVEQVLGYKPDHLIGRKYSEFLDAANPLNNDVADCRRQFNGEENPNRLRVVESKHGQLKLLQVQTHGKIEMCGKVIAIHGIAVDVTDVYLSAAALHSRLATLRLAQIKLTTREKDVLKRIKSGQANKIIAKRLDVGERTVDRIRSKLMKKFNSNNTIEMVAKATELELLEEVVMLGQIRPCSNQLANLNTIR